MDLLPGIAGTIDSANPPYPPFAKGGELSGYEARIPQETGVLPLSQRGIEGDFRAPQLMHESIQNQKLSGTHLGSFCFPLRLVICAFGPLPLELRVSPLLHDGFGRALFPRVVESVRGTKDDGGHTASTAPKPSGEQEQDGNDGCEDEDDGEQFKHGGR